MSEDICEGLGMSSSINRVEFRMLTDVTSALMGGETSIFKAGVELAA